MVGRTQPLGAPRIPGSVAGGGRAAKAREEDRGTLVPPQYHHHTSDGLVSPALNGVNVASYIHRNGRGSYCIAYQYMSHVHCQGFYTNVLIYFLGWMSKVTKFVLVMYLIILCANYNSLWSPPPSLSALSVPLVLVLSTFSMSMPS